MSRKPRNGDYEDFWAKEESKLESTIQYYTENPGYAPWNQIGKGKLVHAHFYNGKVTKYKDAPNPLWKYSVFSRKPDVDFYERHKRKLEEFSDKERNKLKSRSEDRNMMASHGGSRKRKSQRRRKSRRRSRRSLFL